MLFFLLRSFFVQNLIQISTCAQSETSEEGESDFMTYEEIAVWVDTKSR
jgi:hypothetical protein